MYHAEIKILKIYLIDDGKVISKISGPLFLDTVHIRCKRSLPLKRNLLTY